MQQVVRQAIQEAVPIIQTARYKRVDQNMSTIKTEKLPNSSYGSSAWNTSARNTSLCACGHSQISVSSVLGRLISRIELLLFYVLTK